MTRGTLFSLTCLLAGCSGFDSVPYLEPTPPADMALVRVTTNTDVHGDSVAGSCVPKVRHLMAMAGRGFDKVSSAYPAFPRQSASVGMSPPVMPSLPFISGVRQAAAGPYQPVITEYRVPVSVPFMFSTNRSVAADSNISSVSCPEQSKVYRLEAGQQYEVTVGIDTPWNSKGTGQWRCVFEVRKLVRLATVEQTLPVPVQGSTAPEENCRE